MGTLLICDDSALDRHYAARLLEQAGHLVLYAANGREAAELLPHQPADVVLTDMQMPEMDGLELVQHIREHHPSIPVILMTAFGSEEIAVKALQAGAASYVAKQNLKRDLISTVFNLLEVAKVRQEEAAVLEGLTETSMRFELASDLTHIGPLVGHFQDQLKRMNLCDATDLVRVGTALQEALTNAIEHGNLELDSRLREEPNWAYQKLASRRQGEDRFRGRRVYVSARFTREQATFSIRDEGPGFDPTQLRDPTAPENVGNLSGRGLFLIRTFMDHVSFNSTGNEITMTKYRKVAKREKAAS